MQSLWLFTGAFFASLVLVSVTGWLALRKWKRTVDVHWTERARVLWPARMDVRNGMLACNIMGVILAVYGPGEVPERWLPLTAGMILGGTFGNYPFERTIEPRHRFRSWLNTQAWGLFTWMAGMGIVLLLMFFLPYHMTARDWWIAGVGLTVATVVMSGLLLPIMARLSKHVPMEERLQAAIHRSQENAGVSARRVWVVKSPMANAFAMPLTQEVGVTSRLLEILSDAELETVMRHEFAHLTEPRSVVWARTLRALAWLPVAFMHPAAGRFGPMGTLAVLLCPWVINNLVSKLSRRMEHRADRAVVASSDDPTIYASALEKIYEANQIPAVLPGNKTTHPHLYDRMVHAGVTPTYPRPLPPAKHSAASMFALLLAVILVAGRIVWLARENALAL